MRQTSQSIVLQPLNVCLGVFGRVMVLRVVFGCDCAFSARFRLDFGSISAPVPTPVQFRLLRSYCAILCATCGLFLVPRAESVCGCSFRSHHGLCRGAGSNGPVYRSNIGTSPDPKHEFLSGGGYRCVATLSRYVTYISAPAQLYRARAGEKCTWFVRTGRPHYWERANFGTIWNYIACVGAICHKQFV